MWVFILTRLSADEQPVWERRSHMELLLVIIILILLFGGGFGIYRRR